MPFKNRIRLPLVLKNAQFPSEQDIFRKANGATKTLSVVVRKTYQIETDQLPELIHQRLKIALSHDEVTIESAQFVGDVSIDGDYQINWQDFLYYPLAKAEQQVQVTPFDATNDNCGTCEEYAQLALEDDDIYPDVEPSEVVEVSVYGNDSICCSPFTAEITTFNTTYVESATIDETTGIITITMKDSIPSGSDINLVTYRVSCPNGQFDDASVFANVDGNIETCLPPTNLGADVVGETTATMLWTASASAVDEYLWELYLCSDLGTPVQTGSTVSTSVDLTGLLGGFCYRFFVTTDCLYSDTDSVAADVEFTTINTSSSCGSFTMTNDNYPSPATIATTYMDCLGEIQHEFVSTSITRCLLMDDEGDPVYLVMHAGGSWVYNGPCEGSLAVEVVTAASEFLACSGGYETRYIAATDLDIHTGVSVYFDTELESPVGSGYIKDITGEVFVLNSGVVGITTGNIC